MPSKIYLNEALEQCLTAIVERLENAAGEGQPLGKVRNVIRGDRSRPNPEAPALWVRGLTATPTHEQRSMAEKWQAEYIIIAIVKSMKPEEGYQQATELAAKARTEVLKDRTLGKRDFVQDVRSGQFEQSGPDMQNDTLFAATAVIQVHFLTLEDY